MEAREFEVRVFYGLTADFTAAEVRDRMAAMLSADELDRGGRIVHRQTQEGVLLAHAMKRWVLSGAAGVPPASLRFDRDANGKPRIDAPAEACRLQFSLAHHPGIAAFAIAEGGRIGVDVEDLARQADVEEVCRVSLTPEEAEFIRQQEGGRRHESFIRTWTLKEAYSKALGLGLARDFRSFRFVFDSDRIVCFDPRDAAEPARGWHFRLERVGGRYGIAAAAHDTSGRRPRLILERFAPETLGGKE